MPSAGRKLSGLPDEAGAGLGHRDADPRRSGADRSEAKEEGLERRLDPSTRSRGEDHQDEGWADALGAQGEHAVDLETGAIVGVTVQDADEGDTTTSRETLIDAAERIEAVRPDGDGLQQVVGDKGSHCNQSLVDREAVGVRTYISEPDRGRRNWKKNPEARDAVYRKRRRIRGPRGQRLLRLRGERLARPFAHLYQTGGMRRVHLRGHANILKRLLIHSGAFNLGLLMRQLIGVGTPRRIAGPSHRHPWRPAGADSLMLGAFNALQPGAHTLAMRERLSIARDALVHVGALKTGFTTGC